MNNFLRSIPAFCAIIIVTCFMWANMSCKQDHCNAVNCLNNGVCHDGVCYCPANYTGVYCQTPRRAVFIGSYTVRVRNGNVLHPTLYSVGIAAAMDTVVTDIAIQNLLNYFTSVSAYVSHDSLYIPSQQTQGKSITGSGYLIRPPGGSNAPNQVAISTSVTDLSGGGTSQETDTLQ